MWIGLRGSVQARRPLWERENDRKYMYRNWLNTFPRMNQYASAQCGLVSIEIKATAKNKARNLTIRHI